MKSKMELQRKTNTLPALLEVSKSVGVQMLQNNDLKGFVSTVPATIEKIAESTPVCVLRHVVPIETMQMLLEVELTKLAARMNVAHNLNNHQIVFTAETLLEDFKSCSLEDFVFVFKQIAKGAYGSTYHSLDTSVITICMQEHLEQKAYYQERNNSMAENSEPIPDIDYEAFKIKRNAMQQKEQYDKEADFNRKKMEANKELEYMKVKDSYKPDEEKAKQILLKQAWMRECFNPLTGKPNDKWVEFEKF